MGTYLATAATFLLLGLLFYASDGLTAVLVFTINLALITGGLLAWRRHQVRAHGHRS